MIIPIESIVEGVHGHTEVLRESAKGGQCGCAIATEYPGETRYSYPQDFGHLFPVQLNRLCRLFYHATNYILLLPICQMGTRFRYRGL